MGLPFIGDIWGAVSGAFSSVAGWAVDSVISAITTWVIAGVLALIEAMWSVIDATTHTTLTADCDVAVSAGGWHRSVDDRDHAVGGVDSSGAVRITGRVVQGGRP
jgi:hypothetical protein